MRPAIREKCLCDSESLRDSESLPVVQRQTHIRPISWSKPIRDSEGRTPPPLIGRGPDIPVCVCMFENACAAVRQREVSSLGPSDKQSGCSRGWWEKMKRTIDNFFVKNVKLRPDPSENHN